MRCKGSRCHENCHSVHVTSVWSEMAPQLLLEGRQAGRQEGWGTVLGFQSVPSPHWGSIKFVLGERGTLSPDPQALSFILRLPVALVTNWWLVQDHYLCVPVTDTRESWGGNGASHLVSMFRVSKYSKKIFFFIHIPLWMMDEKVFPHFNLLC